MRLFRATLLDAPDDPFRGGVLRAEDDGGLLVDDEGIIAARGSFASLASAHPRAEVVDLSGGLVLPGFVDTHVHFPQLRCIGALGMPLLEWLERCALPEEARLADTAYAVELARAFVHALAGAGTTTALVFGAHYLDATEALFAEADRLGLRVTSGLVVSDRDLRDDLLTTPGRAYDEALTLAKRWHGVRRNRYAVTPRFALSCTPELLDSCAALLNDVPGSILTSHVNENTAEITRVRELFPEASSYVDTYVRHGLLGPGSVLAHDVHPTGDELAVLAAAGAAVSHCPTSNLTLGSGLFPLGAHLDAGVPVTLGSDVGAGTGLSLFKEGLQAYFVQQALGDAGVSLTSAHLLHLATTAGAVALGLGPIVGSFGEGMAFDAMWLRPSPGTPLDILLRYASSADDALAKAFAHATSADVAQVWVAGALVSADQWWPPV
ncbi:MAG TPA: guanine deaminase [Nocardioides sp.]|nr:guanine deaminase [Nocardioides sp.]